MPIGHPLAFRPSAAGLVVFALLLATGEGLAQPPIPIERLMATAFPTELVAAPGHPKLAWVRNAEGVRNVWIAEGPAYEGRPLTSYGQDDGQALTDLQWTPDGRAVVFVRGGAPNRQGEIPNPTSAPDGADRAIWTVEEGGEPRELSTGSAPAVSPQGGTLVFLRAGQVWSISLDGGDPERLFAIRGNPGALRWSPDGTQIAFVSARGDHSFVGVYDVAGHAVRYLDPSVDRDGSPAWSPDGSRIAFTRIPNNSSVLPFMPLREAHPWSIRIADVATGEGREVWRATEGRGSVFRGVEAANPLIWSADNRVVFPWEREGWVHLYSIPVSGGNPTALTTGEFEVEHMAPTPDGHSILYSSNQGDIDRRYVWRVAAAGGPPHRITNATGIEWAPVTTTDGITAMLASDGRRPAHAAVTGADGTRRPIAAGAFQDFPVEALVEPQAVVFSASDGMRIHGQLFLPPDLTPGQRRPAVVFFHGGSRRQMLLGWHYRGYYHNAYAFNQHLASRGFIVLSVNYRSGTGYGLDFREALNYGARGASEFNDVMGAGIYLQGRPDVDPDRIGLWGGSYGGYLTALGLARASHLFAAGVDVHGVHDWNVVIRNFRSDYDPTARAEHARLAFQSSPMASIDTWRSPVLLIHGDDDRNVPFSESVDLVESLRAQEVEFEQLVFPDEVHGFLLHQNWLAAYRAAADFLERKLADAGAGRRTGN